MMCIQYWSIEQISAVISIATPFILLIWFYYTQRQNLSEKYYTELDGLYAGFTQPISKIDDATGLIAGIIMIIRETDSKGFFKGEFDFAETKSEFIESRISHRKLRDGIHTFYGKLDFELYRNKSRHPFVPSDNRVYKGTLYVVDRLDFSFDNYKIEDYVSSEYEILHYREMGTMKFTLKKSTRQNRPELPTSFTLYRKMGANFEPYINVKQIVFLGDTRTDK